MVVENNSAYQRTRRNKMARNEDKEIEQLANDIALISVVQGVIFE